MQYYYNNPGGMNFQNDYYYQLMEARTREKKALFSNASKLGIILLIYNFLNTIFLNIYYLLVYAYHNDNYTLSVRTAKLFLQENMQIVNSSTFSMAGNLFIITVSLTIVLVIARAAMKIELSEMIKPRKEHAVQAAKWFPLCMTLNVAVGIIVAYFTLYMNELGVTVPESDLSIKQPSTAAIILQISYVIIIGPIAEEVLYRGIILTLLKPYGKFMAVFFSALIFGLMHGNIAQAASAFASALVFGLIAVQCNSIVPTIIIHIINNMAASYLDFADVYNWAYAQEIYMAFDILIIFIGVFILFNWGWKLRLKNDSGYALTSSQRYATVFTNVFMMLYFAYVAFEFVRSFIYANS